MPDHTRHRASTASLGQPPGLRALPVHLRMLGRPQSLTRAEPLPMGRDIARLWILLLYLLTMGALVGCGGGGGNSGQPTLSSLVVSPSTPSLEPKATQQFTATGTFSDHSTQDRTSTVTWTSSRTEVATITAAGQLSVFYVEGRATITAAVPGVVTSNPIIIQVTFNSVTVSISAIQSQAQERSLVPFPGTTPSGSDFHLPEAPQDGCPTASRSTITRPNSAAFRFT